MTSQLNLDLIRFLLHCYPLVVTQLPGYGCMDDLTTELRFDSFFVILLSIGVCTTSGRLEQELNVYTIFR